MKAFLTACGRLGACWWLVLMIGIIHGGGTLSRHSEPYKPNSVLMVLQLIRLFNFDYLY